MSTRIVRTIALGVGAGALVLATAGPAFAADTVTALPGKTTVTKTVGTLVQVLAANQPAGFACGTPNVSWSARIPGKQDAVLINGAGTVANACVGTNLELTVTSNNASAKKNAVVKFVGIDTKGTAETEDDAKAVLTLVVKVTDKTGNPGKGPKN